MSYVVQDANALECTNKKGEKKQITADTFVVAVGGRPKYMGLPNEQDLCITRFPPLSNLTVNQLCCMPILRLCRQFRATREFVHF